MKTNSRYVLAVLAAGFLLNSLDRTIIAVLLEPIGREFGVGDTELGLLTGLAFAAFYSTLGIPIAALADRTSRRNVLAFSILLWSVATVLCGLAATFLLLLFARIGTAIGEAGGTPPSHSLISDYFTPARRATALAIYSLGAPVGAALAGLWGGYGSQWLGWRTTIIVAGLPGLLLAPLVLLTVADPRRTETARRSAAPPFVMVAQHLWARLSFRHLWLACALHSIAVHSSATFNPAFLMRSHGWETSRVGELVAIFGAAGAIGTFLGGTLADRLSNRSGDARWLLWVPALATLAAIPFQTVVYMGASTVWATSALPIVALLSMMFFGPAFAVGQTLAAPGMRAVATSVLLFAMAMIGLGLGPLLVGMASDRLMPFLEQHSLRHALLLAPLFNAWSVVHFYLAARWLRADLALPDRMHEESKLPICASTAGETR